MTPAESLLEFVEVQANGCWHWTGHIRSDGYPQLGSPVLGEIRAYRAIYRAFVGPIASGFQVDHLCHNDDLACAGGYAGCPHRRCVNPAHLEAVPRAVNMQRANEHTRRRRALVDNGGEAA